MSKSANGNFLRRLARFRIVGKIKRWPWNPIVTGQGLLYICAIIVIGLTAVISANNLLYLLLSAMLAALLVSGLTSRLSLAGLEFRLSWPDRVFAGEPTLARVSIRNLKSWMPSFSVTVKAGGENDVDFDSIHFPVVTRRERVIASAPVTFRRRGLYPNLSLDLSTRFPFGFVERSVGLQMREGILVLPSAAPSEESRRIVQELGRRLNQTVIGESQDLYRLRPAEPTDSARIADWKATARAGELWVREFTSEDARRLQLVLDRCIPPGGSADEFEKAVQLCSAVTFELERLRARVTLVSDEGVYADASDVFSYLALVQPADGNRSPSPLASINLADASYTFSCSTSGTPTLA